MHVLCVAQMVKSLPAMQETWVQSLGWEDPLKEGMATHSSTLAWKIPMDRGAWRAAIYGITESQTRLTQLSSSGRASRAARFVVWVAGLKILFN